jgi:hypothetical protein
MVQREGGSTVTCWGAYSCGFCCTYCTWKGTHVQTNFRKAVWGGITSAAQFSCLCLCVCMYVHVFIYIHMHVSRQWCSSAAATSALSCFSMSVCIYACIYIHTYACEQAFISACIYIHTHACEQALRAASDPAVPQQLPVFLVFKKLPAMLPCWPL